MDALTSPMLLTVWEEGDARHPLDRALQPLAATLPDWSWDELAALPIGRRDALLLRLRGATFGSRLEMLAACPACREMMEFDAAVDELTIVDLLPLPTEPPPVIDDRGEHPLRRLTSVDLARAGAGARDAARGALAAMAAPGLSAAAAAAALADADPQAELVFTLECPSCGHGWRVAFDIADYLWREIAAAAKRMLDDVQELAAHYGWSEAEVVAMSPVRRRHYLERARG